MIYYPRLDWKVDRFNMEYYIYNNEVKDIDRHFVNKGNRLIMFDNQLTTSITTSE